MENSYISRREHDEFVRRMDDEHKRINKRLSDHDTATKQLNDLINAVGKLAVNMENVLTEIKDQGRRLERIEDEPRQNTGAFKKSIINAIGAAVGSAIVFGLACLIYFTMKG